MSKRSIAKEDAATADGTSGNGVRRARQLADVIAQDISFGKLSAGAWLKQSDLEARYQASRMDIRHALDRLEEKGLVWLEPNKGYRVNEFDFEAYREIIETRSVLEIAAAALVVERIDDEGVARLTDAAAEFEAAVAAGTFAVQEAANHDFHRIMLEFCPNKAMVALIFDLRARVPVVLTRETNTASIIAQTVRDHFEIVSQLRARDAAGLEAVIRRHLKLGICASAEAQN